MPTEVFKFIEITYTVCLPIVLAYITKKVNQINLNRQGHAEAFAYLSNQMEINNQKIDTLTKIVEEDRAMTARYRIIRFDDEMTHGMIHSEDHIDQIIEDINTYQAFCNNHPDFVNHKGQNAMARIIEADKEGKQI